MKIVITGSESFIGSELKRQCRERGIEVVGLDMVASSDPGHSMVDIRSPALAASLPQGAEALVHLAALSTDKACRANPRLAFDVNVGGTINVYEAAAERGIRQVIFASSEWVYGDTIGANDQSEDAPIDVGRVRGEYALTKIVGERVLSYLHERLRVPVTVLRFGIVYGPRPANWSAVEQLFHSVRTAGAVEVKGSLRSARRYVHVADIASGILSALGRSGYEVFNLTGDRLVSLGDVIRESAELLGRTPHIVEGDPNATTVRDPPNAKARRSLSWVPRVGLRAGLATLTNGTGGVQ